MKRPILTRQESAYHKFVRWLAKILTPIREALAQCRTNHIENPSNNVKILRPKLPVSFEVETGHSIAFLDILTAFTKVRMQQKV
ncbi:hypothetical protein X801_06224 [Opisthorchis viverrini]|uniref:Uncharacterized protein n=1 Tax=Opisthorchis viverrini TaxID=6198 RepID=A0A1S8WU06_OPIVI|nr:hypothetical protein X801_06224 [Opisthorchis viverrini]